MVIDSPRFWRERRLTDTTIGSLLAVMEIQPPQDGSTAAERPSPGRRARSVRARWAWRIVRSTILIYVLIVAVLAALQTRLIFPGAATQGKPTSVVAAEPGCELVALTTRDGTNVKALFGPALTPAGRPRADAASRPTILYFYGNGMYLKAALPEFDDFRRLGANVMVAEYVGYGMSDGTPSESGCYATADAAYEHLLKRKDIDPKKIVVAGWSLGGAVAIDLASRRPVAGLVSFCSFTRMVEVVRVHMPFLPASLLLRHRFESEQKIARIGCPSLIGHGTSDEIIPYPMSDRLARAAGGRVTQFAVKGAGHNDFFLVGGPEIKDALQKFLEGIE
jgi:pimeloyl-ACP methyl ester carboxylesterase